MGHTRNQIQATVLPAVPGQVTTGAIPTPQVGTLPEQELNVTFQGLTPQQQQQLGGFGGFRTAVQQQQQQFGGLTQPAAIGNVIGGLRRGQITARVAPTPTPTPPPGEVPVAPGVPAPPGVTPPTPPPVGEITDLERQLQEVAGREAPEFGETPEAALLRQRQEALTGRRPEQLAAISAAFQEEQRRAREVGRRTLGGVKAALARVGALTATPVIAEERQAEVQRRTEEALNRLVLAEQQALQSAQNAFAAEDFELANRMLEQARTFRQDFEANQQRELQNILGISREGRAVRGEQREERAFQIEQQREQTEQLFSQISQSPQTFLDLDPASKQQLEQQIGVPTGFIDDFVNIQEQRAVAETAEQQFRSDLDLLKILKDIPQNQEIQLSDGTIITGLEPVKSNTQTFKSTDPFTGDETFITIDKVTGEPINVFTQEGVGRRFKTAGRAVGGGAPRVTGELAPVGAPGLTIEDLPDALQTAVRAGVLTLEEAAQQARGITEAPAVTQEATLVDQLTNKQVLKTFANTTAQRNKLFEAGFNPFSPDDVRQAIRQGALKEEAEGGELTTEQLIQQLAA